MRFERGERFYFRETPWAVLESDNRRVLAVNLSAGNVEQLPASKRLKRTDKFHSALIREVDLHLENLDAARSEVSEVAARGKKVKN